jgi:glycosyltransferase involved in cell wall biosynthesis
MSAPVTTETVPITEISSASRSHVPTALVDNERTIGQLRNPSERRLPNRSSVSLIIPAKNEARNLSTVLDHLPDCVDEVILVDGQSSDVTQLMAVTCRPDIRIIDEPAAGKGNALRAGFSAARNEVIVAMDADGSMLPEEIPQIVYFLDHGFDFVKGSRFVGGGGSLDITPLRKLGNKGLMMLANHFFETQMTDLCYGFFGFRRQYLDHLGLTSAGFEIETELTVRAVTSGLRIAEVPSLEMPRRSGSSNLHSVRDGIRVLRTLLHERSIQNAPKTRPATRA